MNSTIRSNGGKPMASDSEAKKRWDKENISVFSVKLFRKTDQDIIEYFSKNVTKERSRYQIVKQALRLLMAQEGFVYTPPTDNTDEGE